MEVWHRRSSTEVAGEAAQVLSYGVCMCAEVASVPQKAGAVTIICRENSS